jgi:hypothetical protein
MLGLFTSSSYLTSYKNDSSGLVLTSAIMLGFALFVFQVCHTFVGWVEVRNPTSLGRAQPNLRNLLVAEVRTNPDSSINQ